eukprot:TRINITY_DN17100_c0_g1_i1.p1 TRINITY_DN17100_c0_g1~~TRINITY_DN17100_c0_g1_i1.p1  ORF type:complete len:258 (-),score=55.91 TRINITY_DN17100_c0_g1_i1:19-792(-)
MEATKRKKCEEDVKEEVKKVKPEAGVFPICKLPQSKDEKALWKRLIVVLEAAPLETIKKKKGIELLNSDDHKGIITGKLGKTLEDYRPDIVHQSMLALLDSPLNKAGLLQIYIRTQQNVVIEVNPQLRIPRTFKRFSGLIAQLLTKYKIRGEHCPEFLLKVIKAPIENYFPIGCPKIGTSVEGKLIDVDEYVKTSLPDNVPVVIAIGSVSKGHPGKEAPYVEDVVSVSKFPLSAACCCFKFAHAFEHKWGVKQNELE